jgi:predicted Zn-dependent protease with MMP-like domain
MDAVDFEELVAEALESLPGEFARLMVNVEVLVLPHATPKQLRSVGLGRAETLLGLYEGVPLTQRTAGHPPLYPDRITLFRVPLVRMCRTREELKEQVRRTVMHEIAHFFGISDDRLRELGAY